MSSKTRRPATYVLMAFLAVLTACIGAFMLAAGLFQDGGSEILVVHGTQALVAAALFAAAAGAIGLLGEIRDLLRPKPEEKWERLLGSKPEGRETTFRGVPAVQLGSGRLALKTHLGWAAFTNEAQAARYLGTA